MTLTIKRLAIIIAHQNQVTELQPQGLSAWYTRASAHALQTIFIKGKLQKLFRPVRRLQSVD